jgi:hypothetical protein
MALLIPREIVKDAEQFASDKVDEVLKGMFGLIQAATLRRQSFAFAQEKALFHERMLYRLTRDGKALRIAMLRARIRRHTRLALRWSSLAYARNPDLSRACGVSQVCV